MRMTLTTTLFAILALSPLGCEKKTDSGQTSQEPASVPASAQHGEHAQAGVQPGSHEDWCGEHEVPESQCTRCNSSLIAAFKATGDWCEEHGLPESQCLVCNPELKIERPPRTGETSP